MVEVLIYLPAILYQSIRSGIPLVVRRGEPVCPGREAGRRASAAGPGMAHRRVPLDKGGNRGHPTQEGEQAGVAFLLVTFLWPRKEKSLAQARRAGETPSRAAPSCPARRSHAFEAWGGIRLAMPLPTPHPSPLPQGERGSLLRLEARPGLLTHRGWNPRPSPRRGMPGWHPPTTLPPLAVATTMRR